jgi:transposase
VGCGGPGPVPPGRRRVRCQRPFWWQTGQRLLRGESLEALSRELQVEAHRLAAWRDDLLEGGKEGLKGQRPDRSGDDRALRQAERKVGQLTMENEILRAAAEKRGVQIPPAKRPR